MGKPQAIYNDPGGLHTFWVNPDGDLCEAYDESNQTFNVLDVDYEPNADVTIGRVWPDPNNPYYKLYWVSAAHQGGRGMRTMYWKSDHWEGPFYAGPR